MISTKNADRIATITLNRPDKLNAFSGTMREDLLDALRNAERDAACRVIVITGAGRAFCAGGDVDSMSGLQRDGDLAAFRKLLDAGGNVVLQIASMEEAGDRLRSTASRPVPDATWRLRATTASPRTPQSSARRSSRSDCIPTGAGRGCCPASSAAAARRSC